MRLLVTHHQSPGQIGQIGRIGHFVHAWGIATETLRRDARAAVATTRNVALKAGGPVAAFVARGSEPCRGFHIFMRALRFIQETAPCCRALIVGGEEDEASHGTRPFGGAATWREKMLSEVRLEPARTRFLSRMSRASCVKLLQVPAARVYLNCPFVLRASLLESMARSAPSVASDTAPVREVIREGSQTMRTLRRIGQLLLWTVVLTACGNSTELAWTEDVKLPDGRVLTLTRWVEFKGPHAMDDTATESKQRLEVGVCSRTDMDVNIGVENQSQCVLLAMLGRGQHRRPAQACNDAAFYLLRGAA